LSKVLIACEESQTVCKAFRALGHEAYSNDLQNCSGGHPEWHLNMDCFEAIYLKKWDLMIAHPPCAYLSNAGIGWFNEVKYGEKALERKRLRDEALIFVTRLYNSHIPRICIENPTGWLNSHFRKPDQIIQPYYFGDTESKRTCLWLKNLPPLYHNADCNLFDEKVTHVEPKIYGYYKKVGSKKFGQPIYGNNYLKFSDDRAKIRSKTFDGIAAAMANQWSKLL
jgi:hypothetical protein